MKDILRTIIYIVVIGLAIYFLIWLFYENGFNIIKAKTNEAVKGEPFDKNGENVASWLVGSKNDCEWECKNYGNPKNDPVYIYEELTNEEIDNYKLISPLSPFNEKGHCYCKY